MNKTATGAELVPVVVRELDLAPGSHPHDTLWLSATSGFVCVGRHAYVVADDEHHLGHFDLRAPAPVELLRLFEGSLPRDKDKRKKAKPDLESLVLLPALDPYPHGALLALGSGSRPSRRRASLLALNSTGMVQSPPVQLDLSALYAPLQDQFGDLNIEGAFIADGQFHVLQRGNKGGPSARISFDWKRFAAWLVGDDTQVPVTTRVQRLEAGSADEVPLAPTDAAALTGGKWLFSAVAENSCDSYSDGPCMASAIGIADNNGRIAQIHRLRGSPKVEGIAVEPGCDVTGPELRLLLVTDADDPELPSRLLRVTLHTAA